MWIGKLAAVVLYTALLGSLAVGSVLIAPRGGLILRIARVWCRWVSATAGVGYRVRGADRIDWSRNYLIVSNHQSQFDIPALVQAIPIDFRMVAKRNLFWIPVFGWALWLAGFVGINRSDRRQAFRSLDRAAERVRRGASVVVFAEGTRSRDGRLLPFKKGPFVLAIRSEVPILPVAVRGGLAVLRKGSLRIRTGVMEVVFGDPIPTAGYSYEQRDLLVDRVRRAIEALLGCGAPEAAAGSLAATK